MTSRDIMYKLIPTYLLKAVKQFVLPFLMTECLQKHIDEMLRVVIIEKRRSKYTAPIFCIGKPGKDGKVPPKKLWDETNSRFLINLREINKAIKDSQLGISEVISDLSSKTNFISINDIWNEFSHSILAEKSQNNLFFRLRDFLMCLKSCHKGQFSHLEPFLNC